MRQANVKELALVRHAKTAAAAGDECGENILLERGGFARFKARESIGREQVNAAIRVVAGGGFLGGEGVDRAIGGEGDFAVAVRRIGLEQRDCPARTIGCMYLFKLHQRHIKERVAVEDEEGLVFGDELRRLQQPAAGAERCFFHGIVKPRLVIALAKM